MCQHVWLMVGKGLFECCIYCGESRKPKRTIRMSIIYFFEQVIAFFQAIVAALLGFRDRI
jgi:hypothetical protein